MDKQRLHEFLKRYAENDYTDQEHKQFIDWLNWAPISEIQVVMDKYQDLTERKSVEETEAYPALIQGIESKLDQLKDQSLPKALFNLRVNYRKIAAIAAMFFMIAAFALFFRHDAQQKQAVKQANIIGNVSRNKITPGGNKATLTLANGEKIILENARNGVLANQFGTSIRKTDAGHVSIEQVNNAYPSIKKANHSLFNTIVTPRGGQYQVTLSDGSKVWLNAASSLRFPASFSKNERIVELVGEAYFEVAKSVTERPFKVVSGTQVIEVLGTHFNINAYSDEAEITTTLLEGSVKVLKPSTFQSQLLKPGQQARVAANIQVSDVDVSRSVAWKNGYFSFSNENIETIMRNISRWYDVDIKYQKNTTREEFVGSVSRYENVSQVLNMLQLTGSVHFKIEGRRITVMP